MAIVMMAMSPQMVWALSGSGTSSSPYLIYSADDLAAFRDIVNSTNGSTAVAKLMNDITLSGKWTPIGRSDHRYKGTFYGQNHTIKNLYIDINSSWELGLFGYIENATIQDFTLDGGQLASTTNQSSEHHSYGSAVGAAHGSSVISNVTSNVGVSIKHSRHYRTGGIVGGLNGTSKVTNCTYTGTIENTTSSYVQEIGGIVGNANGSISVQNCTFSGTMKTVTIYIGGIIGFIYNSSSTATISNCTNTGSMIVSGGGEIGGIIGHSAGNLDILNNTFASGATLNTAESGTVCYFVGGITGKTDGTILIQECTAAGSINVGESYDCIAGIVGYCNDNSKLTIKSCLYSGHISNTSTRSDINRVAGIIAYASDNGNNFGGIKGCLCCGSFSTPSSNTIKPAAIASALYNNALDRMTDNYYRSDMATAVVFHTSSGHSIASSNYSRTTAQISNGQVAYELNGSVNGGTTWRQNISSGTVDNNPVLDQTHNKVYYSYVNCEARAKSYNNRDEQTRGHKFTTSKGSGVYQCTVCSRLGGTKPTITNNVYQIATAGNLIYFSDKTNGYGLTSTDDMTMATGISGKLTANIDMSGYTMPNSIGEGGSGYTGTFEGNYKTISNTSYRALFCVIASGGVVQNMDLYAASSKDSWQTGNYQSPFVRRNNGTIQCCRVSGSYWDNSSAWLGGITGVNESGGKILNCGFFDSTLRLRWSANTEVAGIAALNYGTVQNCFTWNNYYYNIGSYGQAGVVNNNASGATVSNCYTNHGTGVLTQNGTATGITTGISADFITTGEMCYKLNGSTSSGTLTWYQKIGSETFPHFVKADGKTVYYSYAYCEARSLSYNNVTSRTTRGHNFAVKNSTQGVYQCSLCNHWGGTKPTITNGVYHIATAGNLVYFSDKTNGLGLTASDDMASVTGITAVLDNDIDMSSVGAYIPAALYSDDNAGYRKNYSGSFDGQGHTISNLKVVGPATCEAGLFGRLQGTVKNLLLKDETVTGTLSTKVGGARLGGLAGLTFTGANISCCGVMGLTITEGNSGAKYDGGIVGAYAAGAIAFTFTDYSKFFGTGSQVSSHTNCFENVTATQKTSGELCWKLNGGAVSGQVWHQNLSGTKDSYPIPSNTHSTVYITLNNDCEFAYTNTAYTNQTLNLSVGTAAKLNNVARLYANGFVGGTVNVTLTGDIDYTAYKTVYDMIGLYDARPYKGTFDGQGHSLKVDITHGENYVAPFRSIDGATIKNLYLYGSVTNTGGGCAAGVVSHVLKNACTLENIICDVEIISTMSGGSANGGLVAHAYTADVTINNCAYRGKFNGANAKDWGGFIGWIENGRTATINNSYVALDSKSSYSSTGCATFARKDSGTLAGGNNYYYTKIGVDNWTDCSKFEAGELCYKLNGSRSEGTEESPLAWYQTLTGTSADAYPILTKKTGNTVYFINNYYCDGTTVKSTCYSNDANASTTDKHEYEAENNTTNGFCHGTAGQEHLQPAGETTISGTKYYTIGNAGQLYWFADKVNNDNANYITAKAKLTDNIVVNKGTFAADGTWSETGTPRSWTPIGKGYVDELWYDFKGTFDGDGHTVSGLYFNNSATNYVGLIGSAANATIKRVGVVGGYIYGNDDVGGVCGLSSTSTINDCYATCTILGDTNVGGISGRNEGFSTISNCYATGAVTGSQKIGGVCGLNYATITNCYATGTVTGSQNIGGVCGHNSATISNCYATGAVTGEYYVGGICGENFGTISNCYATGTVTGSSSIGGVCGYNNSNVSNCYATATVTCDDEDDKSFGGICGSSATYGDDPISITNCYSLIDPIGESYNTTLTNVEKKDEDAFHSGEITWKLNNGVTDGTQAWYQIAGTGYPSLAKAANGSNTIYLMNRNYNNTGRLTLPMTNVDGTYYTSLGCDFPCAVEDADVYIATAAQDGVLTMSKTTDNIAVGEGVVLKGSAANATLVYKTTATANANNLLHGTTQEITDTDGKLVFAKTDGVIGFYKWTGEGKSIPAFKAYLNANDLTTSSAKGYRLVFEDETTSINNEQLIINNEADAVYNLQGQKLNAPRRGVNIINGKKVLVK